MRKLDARVKLERLWRLRNSRAFASRTGAQPSSSTPPVLGGAQSSSSRFLLPAGQVWAPHPGWGLPDTSA